MPTLNTGVAGKSGELESKRELVLERLGALADYARARGVVVCIEPHVGAAVDTLQRAEWLIKAIDSSLRDYGHYHALNQGIVLIVGGALLPGLIESIGDAKVLSDNLGQAIGSKQDGMYITLGYDIMRLISKGSEHQLSPFIHWEKYNTQAEVAAGYTADPKNDRSTLAFGLAYRPISNVVDVTNYVMHALGNPLHAFDFETLADGRIVVRRARPGERLRTLDGVERALKP